MPFERQHHVGRAHAAAVVTHFDQFEAARRQPNRHRSGAGVERIFYQFFQGTSRALDHLAGGDAIDELGRQPSY